MSDLQGMAALHKAIDMLGTQSAAAAAIGIKQQSVSDVVRTGKRVPAEWCIPLERATRGEVTRHQLRPDIYPEEAGPQQVSSDEDSLLRGAGAILDPGAANPTLSPAPVEASAFRRPKRRRGFLVSSDRSTGRGSP